ncbi:Tankyrase 1 Binding Protein 1 [Saguinus oedipus]|uniref:Tankyrase 1 Binding Protein 1 n=1 Tax=Saguinus oedipus TaxID=9490 RepID=A0ABQ9UUE4_SAGOE|nr:Tankyrase 1 Binding Protein 1 [Saguinus oedipus]
MEWLMQSQQHVRASPGRCPARSPPSGSQGLLEEMLAASSSRAVARREAAGSGLGGPLVEEGASSGAAQEEVLEPGRDSPPSWRTQPDGEASQTEDVDSTWGLSAAKRSDQGPAQASRRPSQGPPPRSPSQDFSFIEVSEG